MIGMELRCPQSNIQGTVEAEVRKPSWPKGRMLLRIQNKWFEFADLVPVE